MQKHLRIYTKEFAHRMTHILPPKKPTHNPAPSTDAAAKLAQVWRETDLGDQWPDAGLPDLVRYLVGARGLKVGSGSYQLNFEHAALIQNDQRVPAEDCCTLNRLLLALSQDHTNSA